VVVAQTPQARKLDQERQLALRFAMALLDTKQILALLGNLRLACGDSPTECIIGDGLATSHDVLPFVAA
jgi:hypothetical protein